MGNTFYDLNAHSKQIGEMVQLLSGITEETQLPALNAAIEAARAGEHGQGFAVVAASIRKLSNRSQTSAAEISELISYVRTQMKHASDAKRLKSAAPPTSYPLWQTS